MQCSRPRCSAPGARCWSCRRQARASSAGPSRSPGTAAPKQPAVGWALPFLDGAGGVHCLTAQTRRTRADAAVDLAEYLQWRAIACGRHAVAVEGDQPVGAALLRIASEIGADLLVMGGYGRARLNELVFGGVTRHVLAKPELPLLISH
jgi:nucleotide-binding universal stress UspA family protein